MPRDADDPIYQRLLVVRCQVGDRAALHELFKLTHDRLRGFVFKLLPPVQRHRLDDLLQDVWADVFRDLPKLIDAGAFGPWLFRIARNRVYRSARRHKRWTAMSSEVDVAELAGDEATGEPFTAADAAAVHAALDQLTPEHREVVMLRLIEDMSYEEIATVVGCPVGTVRSRLHHAKRALAVLLEHKRDHVRR